MPVLLNIKGIGALKHKSRNFGFTIIYIPGIDKKDCEVYASISYKLHLIDRLKANMPVDNNILCTRGFTINFSTSFAFIHSCGVKIDINARQYSKFLRRRIQLLALHLCFPNQRL